MKRRICWFLVSIVLVNSGCVQETWASVEKGYLLIDAGHGGFDGGAVASDGTLEKHVNLDISLCLRDMLVICGFPVMMTRTDDAALSDSESDTIRHKKVSDMRNRLSLYNGAEMVISIHQNHFQSPKYCGAQVFYSINNPAGAQLAESIQSSIVDGLQPQNKRKIKPATDGVYLMRHTTVPSVLVECGFLSNPEELSNLKTTEYRQQMAWAVMLGYWNYRLSEG